jgi:hypothetical protein
MELNDWVHELSGEYARLLLLLDMAREKAHMLGESVITEGLHVFVHDCSVRLEELSREEAARRVATGE